jgi:TetR/AcrR family transcriptional regulator
MIHREPASPAEGARHARESTLRDARRSLILAGAWTVFRRDGLDGATMRAIASAAGCTTGAIYPLFPSKEGIYAALLGESLERLKTFIDTACRASAAQEPADLLRRSAIAFVEYYQDVPDEVALGLYLWSGIGPRGLNPEFDRDLNQQLAAVLDVMGHALDRLGVQEKTGTRAEVANLFAYLIGSLLLHQTGRLRTLRHELSELMDQHMDRLIRDICREQRQT